MRRTLFVNSLPNFVNSVLRVRVGFFEFRINKKLKTIDEKNSRFEMLTDYSTKSSQFGVIKQTLKNFGHTKLSIMSLKLLFFVCKLLESYYFKKGFHLWKNQVQNPSGSVVLKR